MKRLIQNSILIVLTIALATGILWARNKSRGELCERIEVEVVNADSTSFVTPQGILSDLKGQGIKVIGKHMGEIIKQSFELQLDGKIKNAEDAIAWARSRT